MNFTTTKIICLASVVLLSLQVFAQANKSKSFSINFGPEVSFPGTTLRKTHQSGFGGSFKAEYTFGKHASATINSGVSYLKGKNYIDNISTTSKTYHSLIAIPVKAGLRYYVNNFYVAGEAGIVFLNNYTNTSQPALSIGVGDKITIAGQKIDVSFRQEFWMTNPTNLNMAVLRVAYEIVW